MCAATRTKPSMPSSFSMKRYREGSLVKGQEVKKATQRAKFRRGSAITLRNVTTNLKHRRILTIIYSSGHRVSEAVGLQISHVDFDCKQIRIEQSNEKRVASPY